jgi:aminopeptidase N
MGLLYKMHNGIKHYNTHLLQATCGRPLLRIAFYVLFFSFAQVATAQTATSMAETNCKGHGSRTANKTTIADLHEDDYNISHVKLDLQLTDASAGIAGVVTTSARVVAASMDRYVFELDDTLIIDSVILDGSLLPFTTSGTIRTVMLPTPLAQGATFRASVHYRGYPRNADGIHDPGLHFDKTQKVTFSLGEPYFASMWWPCKQSLRDKIDSADIWITVPAGVKAGSNGTLKHITAIDAGRDRYEWKSRYPIDYYLISVAVCRYYEYTYYMHFDNSDDSMPIVNYVLNVPDEIARVKPWLDSTALLINYMSELFGKYPFWKEKYGHCQIPSGINMEHQTMTSTKFPRLNVVAHELAHQWFGDYVTCGTWKDIWLNEGFATYAQFLTYNHFDGRELAQTYLHIIQENATSTNWGSVYANDTTDWNKVFDGRLSYNKAACVIHMLRYVVNNDTVFFGMLRAYLAQYATGNATTEEFRQVAESYTGIKLDTFFQQWIYGEGFPYLAVTWNQVNDVCFLRINQAAAAPWSVFYFRCPIDIKFHSNTGDTTLRVYFDGATQAYSFTSNHTITGITVDPEHWILFRNAQPPAKDASLNLLKNAIVYPNPANNTLSLSYKGLINPDFRLIDAAGKTVLKEHLLYDAGMRSFDISVLPHGVYIYDVSSAGKTVSSGKIRKE